MENAITEGRACVLGEGVPALGDAVIAEAAGRVRRQRRWARRRVWRGHLTGCSAVRRVAGRPGRGLVDHVDADAERGHGDGKHGKHGKQACPRTGQAPSPSVRTSRGGSRLLCGSADANEFLASAAKFNEYLMTLKILTSSKPETSLI